MKSTVSSRNKCLNLICDELEEMNKKLHIWSDIRSMDQIELYVQQQDMSSIFSYCSIKDNPFLPNRKAMIQQAAFTVPSMKK